MRALLIILLASVAACARPDGTPKGDATATPTGSWSIDPGEDLNAFFECLEREGATLVSAHRGGPGPGLPENAIETMRATLENAPALLEIDVTSSADGVLYLMHDDTLERTTTGAGAANALPYAEIAKLRLEDDDGAPTPYAPPRFEDVLAFARERTLLQVDFKPAARFEDVIAAIRKAGAERRVILIAYKVGAAQKLHRLAPDMMISLNILSTEDLAAARAVRLPAERLLAFTGVEAPNGALNDALNAEDVEVIFGTLGRDGIDRAVEETGDDTQYAELSRIGVDIIATDRPAAAEKALAKAGRAAKAGMCGVKRG